MVTISLQSKYKHIYLSEKASWEDCALTSQDWLIILIKSVIWQGVVYSWHSVTPRRCIRAHAHRMCAENMVVFWHQEPFPCRNIAVLTEAEQLCPDGSALPRPVTAGPSSPVLGTHHRVISSPACLRLPLLAPLCKAPREAALPLGGARNRTAGKQLSLFNQIQTVPLEGKDGRFLGRAQLPPVSHNRGCFVPHWVRSCAHFYPEVSAHHHIILTAGRAGEYTCYSSLKNTYIEIKPTIKKTNFTKEAK